MSAEKGLTSLADAIARRRLLTRRPDVYANNKGVIGISSRVAKLLALSPGDAIDIIPDGQGEYLLYCLHRQPAPLTCRSVTKATRRHSGYLRVNSIALARMLINACGGGVQVKLHAGEPFTDNNTIFLPLITHNPLP